MSDYPHREMQSKPQVTEAGKRAIAMGKLRDGKLRGYPGVVVGYSPGGDTVLRFALFDPDILPHEEQQPLLVDSAPVHISGPLALSDKVCWRYGEGDDMLAFPIRLE